MDTSKLTAREKEQWSEYVSELLAPCPDQPVSLAQCVAEQRKCETCVPAAQFLTHQVTRGKTRSQAEAAFRARFSPDEVREVEVGVSPAKGASEALVTIVEWADFECPFCGMASPLIGAVVKARSQHVRLVFKHYPLSAHEHAEPAARAAVAAGLQGKFWEMHDRLFANQDGLDEAGLARVAKEIGLDLDKFEADRKSEAVADAVAADRKLGDKVGLRGTPTLYINGRYFDLEKFDLQEDLDAWLDLEVALRSGKPQAATSVAAAPSAKPSSPATLPAASGRDQATGAPVQQAKDVEASDSPAAVPPGSGAKPAAGTKGG